MAYARARSFARIRTAALLAERSSSVKGGFHCNQRNPPGSATASYSSFIQKYDRMNMGSDRLHFTQKESRSVCLVAAVGSSSSAVVWTDPGCIGLLIAHGWRLAPTLRCVPHWPGVRARSSGRAAPDARSVCYSLRIGGEDRTELARGELSGNPAPRERAERGWTPGVSARSAMQEGSG